MEVVKLQDSEVLQEEAPVLHLWSRSNDSTAAFFKRTLAAQMHAFASVASVVGLVVLLRLAANAPLGLFVATALFGAAAVLLFGASAFNHFLDDGFHVSRRLLAFLENFDKFSIYLLIASTYTPIVVYTLEGTPRIAMLSLVWAMAASGCLYTMFIERLPRWAQSRIVYTGQFVVLGWTALLRIGTVFGHLSGWQIAAFLAGGLSYTVGAVAYAFKRPNFSSYFGYHELWHLAVIGGCSMFFVVIGSFYV